MVVIRGTVTQFHIGFHTNFLFLIQFVLFWSYETGDSRQAGAPRYSSSSFQVQVQKVATSSRNIRNLVEAKRNENKDKMSKCFARSFVEELVTSHNSSDSEIVTIDQHSSSDERKIITDGSRTVESTIDPTSKLLTR